MKISKSTLKRHCLRNVPHAHDRWSSAVRGTLDAIADARRALRAGSALSFHPDAEDFFGVRLTDSTNGARYVRAFDDAIEVVASLVRSRGRRRQLRRRRSHELRHAA